MSFSLTWLPDVLEEGGLKVAVVDGWERRGRGDMTQVVGVMCHHTAGPKRGNMPSLKTLIEGRGDLPGPLSQLGLGRDGTYYVIAAGRCNHAGKGIWRGVTEGNSRFIGIEAENTGQGDDTPWPEIQLNAYHQGVAAILRALGMGSDFCVGHKEFALPPGRKPDPNIDMNVFRVAVAAILDGTAPMPVLIPAVEPAPVSPTTAPRATLRRGVTGELVKDVQRKLKVADIDGRFGPGTEAALREFQRQRGLVPDGIVGPKTWTALDSVP